MIIMASLSQGRAKMSLKGLFYRFSQSKSEKHAEKEVIEYKSANKSGGANVNTPRMPYLPQETVEWGLPHSISMQGLRKIILSR